MNREWRKLLYYWENYYNMRLLLLCSISICLLFSCQHESVDDVSQVQPHILWISVEDISPSIPMYGDSTIETPNIDRIALGGTVYTHAFTIAGVCAPSRSGIITGMHPQSIGTMHMRTGKDVGGVSKEKYASDIGLKDMTGGNVPEYSAVIPSEVKVFSEYMRREGYFTSNNAKTDYQFAPPMTAWDECGLEGHWRNRQAGEPFFHVRSTVVTHESRIWAKKEDSLLVDASLVPIPQHFPETPIVRQDVARNYSNIKEVDGQIGQLLDQLEEDGLMDSTIIVFWSDHGGPLPRGKREIYDTGIHVPLIIKVPPHLQDHVLGYTVGTDTRHFDDQMISMIDLAPSMLSIIGVEVPDYIQGQAFLGPQRAQQERQYVYAGRDRLDFHYDKVRIVRDKNYLFVKNYYPELPNYMDVRYRRQMDMMQELLQMNESGELSGDVAIWFNQTKPKEEFYIVVEDPLQLNNVIADSNYRDEIIRMRFAIDLWENELNDYSEQPESEMVANMWPDLIQPKTTTPQIDQEGLITIIDNTEGSSIAYQLSDSPEPTDDWDSWIVYDTPINADGSKYIHSKAIRIGYKHSEVRTLKL